MPPPPGRTRRRVSECAALDRFEVDDERALEATGEQVTPATQREPGERVRRREHESPALSGAMDRSLVADLEVERDFVGAVGDLGHAREADPGRALRGGIDPLALALFGVAGAPLSHLGGAIRSNVSASVHLGWSPASA
jgi:hypothetical protein